MVQSPLARRLLDTLGADHGAGLQIGGLPATALADRFGTPLYVYDAEVLRRRYRTVVEALDVEVLYAIKVNPSLAVTAVLAAAGAGADVASAGEILIAERAGVPADRIQFAGPGKTPAELRAALAAGIHIINVESAAEYELLADAARSRGQRPGIAVRVNPAEGVAGARMRMGGGSSKFGVDAEAVAPLVKRIVADDVVELHGLHCYTGTQVFDASAFVASSTGLLQLARELSTEFGIDLPSLNFGGGFGVPCFQGDPEFDLAAAGRGLRKLLDGEERRVFVELGRFLTAPAGVFLTRVLHVKHSRGARIAMLDGGMHHFGAAAGVGAVIRRPFPIVAAATPLAETGEAQTLCGPLCTPVDEFASGFELPRLERGDLVAILGAGAYGLTFSQLAALSHPTPGEVLIDGGRGSLIRRPGGPADALRGQSLPGEE